ncbi:MFS transporter [Enterobacteriaceae bacterium BIT-l23]|uniref:CynX/NimT family MFS transporter n=2 Tax=Enterobacteriaceae TaxID=543 RepID=A0A4P8YUM8_9ENTR|nr:MFS transporter [Enterobacteriaceae bacterium BIT-l23]QCT22722.1 CynX/NimT family MFS transporter [Jejubacter calystegiae]
MMTSSRTSGNWRLLLTILVTAMTLRVSFTAVAPLLGPIGDSFQLSTTAGGLLTTLPLLAFAVVSPLAASLARRLGMERSLGLAMLIITLGIALRSSGAESLLWLGTLIIGGGIALGNVLLPGLIKRDFPGKVAKLTGAYSLTMGVAAACGSALVVPVALMGWGWQGALLALALFPLLAVLLWLPHLRQHQSANVSSGPGSMARSLWRSPLAWQVTLFLGLNSLIYYVVVGWLPAILVSHGFSPRQAGSLHGLMQLATAAPGLFIGLVLARMKDQRIIALLVALLCALSSLGLWLVPTLASLWVVLFGFGSGATMILGLSFIGLRASSAHQAAALSGMAQSVGYLLAACGPPLMGKLHDISASWALPLLVCTLLASTMALFGLCAGRDREIDELPQRATARSSS